MSLESDVEELKKVTYGNGRLGLCDRMTIVEQKTENNTKVMTTMDKTVEGISKAVSEYTGAQKARARTTNILLGLISIILASIGTVIALASHLNPPI